MRDMVARKVAGDARSLAGDAKSLAGGATGVARQAQSKADKANERIDKLEEWKKKVERQLSAEDMGLFPRAILRAIWGRGEDGDERNDGYPNPPLINQIAMLYKHLGLEIVHTGERDEIRPVKAPRKKAPKKGAK